MSGLTNGANLTDYGGNGLGVKKILSDGLDVSFNFLVASMSMPSFLMGCMEKSLEIDPEVFINSLLIRINNRDLSRGFNVNLRFNSLNMYWIATINRDPNICTNNPGFRRRLVYTSPLSLVSSNACPPVRHRRRPHPLVSIRSWMDGAFLLLDGWRVHLKLASERSETSPS
jgi:hypothetical protein